MDSFIHLLQAQLDNLLFVSGMVLGLIGLVGMWLRKMPGLLRAYGNRLVIVS